MLEKIAIDEHETKLEKLTKAYEEVGVKYKIYPPEPFSYGTLNLDGISKEDQEDFLYYIGVITGFINRPMMTDEFEDDNERSAWRTNLPEEVKKVAEQNNLRGNLIGKLKMSLSALEKYYLTGIQYEEASKIATTMVDAISQVTDRPESNPDEEAKLPAYATYLPEQKVAFVQKLNDSAREFIWALEK